MVFLECGEGTQREEEFSKLAERIVEEKRTGSYFDYDFQVVVARMPL